MCAQRRKRKRNGNRQRHGYGKEELVYIHTSEEEERELWTGTAKENDCSMSEREGKRNNSIIQKNYVPRICLYAVRFFSFLIHLFNIVYVQSKVYCLAACIVSTSRYTLCQIVWWALPHPAVGAVEFVVFFIFIHCMPPSHCSTCKLVNVIWRFLARTIISSHISKRVISRIRYHTHTHPYRWCCHVATLPRIIVSVRSQTYANFREYVLNSISANKLHSSHVMMHRREKEIENEFVCGHILGLNNKTNRHNHNKTSIERWKAIDTEAKRRREKKTVKWKSTQFRNRK